MGFAEKYIASLSSQNLRDDAVHHDLDVIAAAALAYPAIDGWKRSGPKSTAGAA